MLERGPSTFKTDIYRCHWVAITLGLDAGMEASVDIVIGSETPSICEPGASRVMENQYFRLKIFKKIIFLKSFSQSVAARRASGNIRFDDCPAIAAI